MYNDFKKDKLCTDVNPEFIDYYLSFNGVDDFRKGEKLNYWFANN